MKFLNIYGNVQKYSWNMIFTQFPNDVWHKRKIYNFDPYNVFLAIARNILQRLKTGFGVQGHILLGSVIVTHLLTWPFSGL